MLQILQRKFIKIVSKLYDPLVNLNIGNQVIKVPFSHQLRTNVKVYPDYNFNLPRIIQYISKHTSNLHVIDIGANIGDTVAFIKNYSNAPILCIDGEKKYFRILKSNVAQYKNVSACNALVGEKNEEANVSMKMDRGTAVVVEAADKIMIRTLENILDEFPDFKHAKVLKIDTDGYDTLILRGCTNLLKTIKPVLFLEYDPYLITQNNDDPFQFIDYLKDCGYAYLIFYTNTGDLLLSCNIEQRDIIDQLINYFSGRNISMFADICAFASEDKELYDDCVKQELSHFKKSRNY